MNIWTEDELLASSDVDEFDASFDLVEHDGEVVSDEVECWRVDDESAWRGESLVATLELDGFVEAGGEGWGLVIVGLDPHRGGHGICGI